MLEAKIRRFRITFAIQSILAFATVAGFALTAVPERQWIAYVLGVLVLVAQIALYRATGNTRVFKFKNDASDRFAKFFSAWYQQQGEHVIFCKDLDWMDGDVAVAQIPESIKRQGAHATLIVSNDAADACTTIRGGGSKIIVVPSEISMKNVKMSLFTNGNGYQQIIVQKKPKDSNTVKFVKTTDPIMIALAETVISACAQLEKRE